MHRAMGDFKIDGMAMRYSQFVPRLYNHVLSIGFQQGRIMPSRAFCSDESQGYPVILIAQHFGTFPFNHGRVGGVVSTNRHGPHADHGQDLVIVQASHVGYDPESRRFGLYLRQHTTERDFGHCCGKLCAVMDWYSHEYDYGTESILLGRIDDQAAVFIDNHLLNEDRPEGLFLRLDRLIDRSGAEPLRVMSTAKAFPAASWLRQKLPDDAFGAERRPIAELLTSDLFFFRRKPSADQEGHDQLEANLEPVMSALCTSKHPALDAARYNTQVEFDRTYRSIQRSKDYAGRNLAFVAGLNIDVSPQDGMLFPLTKFVPWAAYVRLADGTSYLMEQPELVAALRRQPVENPHQISFDEAIKAMSSVDEIKLPPLS